MLKPAAKNTPTETHKPTLGESIRETVDSVVIAFVLAFLFRTFEAEAFVIPTGSMALTLMGDHKDVLCEQCGYRYEVSASSESPQTADDQRNFDQMQRQARSPEEQRALDRDRKDWELRHIVASSVCPNCRYRMQYGDPPPPTYKGDRILVTKYSYDFGDPQRWDVSVFKNPSQAKVNYIKRLVGLPNEEMLIYRGDLYVRAAGEERFRMARKPHGKAAAVAQIVYDNDFVLPEMQDRGWPQRWLSELNGASPLWQQSDDMKDFRLEVPTDGEAWLRYQHYVPSDRDWKTLSQESLDPAQRARLKPQLITDFCEYNTERSAVYNDRIVQDYLAFAYLGLHWVGDLTVECELEFNERENDDAEAILEIVEGGVAYQCSINAATGDAVLSIAGLDGYAPVAKGAVRGNGPHTVRFANVDDQLLLWVGGKPVTFDSSTHFQSVSQLEAEDGDGNELEFKFDGESRFAPLNNLIPKRQDLSSPVGVGGRRTALSVRHLRILRDVYYIADSMSSSNAAGHQEAVRDYRVDDDVFAQFNQLRIRQNLPLESGESLIRDFMSDVDTLPERWQKMSYVHFTLGPDQFFMLGDNSPRSLDSRLWNPNETYVKRELLIGKALFVYWPHGWGTIPGTNVHVPALPIIGGHYVPDFTRMRLIR